MNLLTKSARRAQWDAWRDQAHAALAQGQNINDFVAHAHPDNRRIARKAFKHAIGFARFQQENQTSAYGD